VSWMQPLGTRDLWVYDLARGRRERMTVGPGDDFAPTWSHPDGAHLLYSSLREASIHLYRKPSRGTAGEELLYQDRSSAIGRHLR
jgi:Tol biopolymer transport system component